MRIELYFSLLLLAMVIIICKILKHYYVPNNQILGKYVSNNKVIPWSYSKIQGQWVSPNDPFSPSEMNGNIYIGKDEIDTTWINFNE